MVREHTYSLRYLTMFAGKREESSQRALAITVFSMATPVRGGWGAGAQDEPPGEQGPGATSGVWCEHDSARAVIRAALDAAVGRLEDELPRARQGEDPEGVHQARVATRRIRSDLRTFARLVDTGWRRELRAELSWLADALGRVRDLDVLGGVLAAAASDAGVDPAGLAPILDDVGVRRAEARAELLAVLDSDRAAALLATLRAAAADPPTTGSALGRADLRLRPLVRSPWRKLDRAVAHLGREPAVADLHRVRLLAKRTRYAAEAVVGVFGKPARRFANAVSDVQGVLGDMNDAELAIAHLQHVADTLPSTGAFAAGQLSHHLQAVAEQARHDWQRPFRRARRRSDWLD